MLKALSKLVVPISSLAFGLAVAGVNSASAAIIPYQFEVSVDSGILAGQTFLGSFNIDDSFVLGAENEYVPVSSLEFNFLGSTFTEADAIVGSVAEAFFVESEFLGLSFAVDNPNFSFTPGFFELNEAFFAYTISTGTVGFGDVNYTVVPEPFSLLGAGSAIGFGLFFKRKLAKKEK